MPVQHVIIGTGIAGLSAAEQIRRRDATADITMVGDEPDGFYSRPGIAYLLRGDVPEGCVSWDDFVGRAGAVAGDEPLGAAAGVGVGLGVDYLVNAGVELAQRDAFVADLNATLSSTEQDWRRQMESALQQAVDVWYGDALQLLPTFESGD